MNKFIAANDEVSLNKFAAQTLKKYRILKLRMKISCMAHLKQKTVKELFLDAILRSY